MLATRRAGSPPAPGRVVLVSVLLGAVLLGSVLDGCSRQGAINRRPVTGTGTASVVNSVQQITIKAGDDYRFHPSTVVVHPGRVEVILQHPGTGAPHTWMLTGFPADFVPTTQAGQTRRATFTTPSPGRYEFVCTIHRRQGQRGTLVVLPR
jgi:plastocyanin